MRSNKGFTLIELIVVIVVLGILAVTAAPKFIGVQDEANDAVAEGIVGSINSASAMAHGKALVSSSTDEEDSITVDSVGNVRMAFGYPEASNTGIGRIIEVPENWSVTNGGTNSNTFVLTKDDCVITYTEAENASKPAVAAKTCS